MSGMTRARKFHLLRKPCVKEAYAACGWAMAMDDSSSIFFNVLLDKGSGTNGTS